MLSSHARRHTVLGLTLCVIALFLAVPAAQAGQIVSDANCQANTLAANDDGSTGLVPIGFNANAFGLEFNQLYVNNNGNVTINGPKGEYTPYDFTIGGEPIIAPFFADVDTTGDGSGEVTYGTTTFDGHDAFCVNWVNVGYFGSHADKLNSFQLLLVDRSDTGAGNFDIYFNYDQIQWETGDASDGVGGLGGTSAAFGLTNADGDPGHSYMGEGSFINGALLDGGPNALTGQSNVGVPGRFIFAIRNTPPTGVHLTGVVQNSALDPIAGAPVQICNHDTNACVTRLTDGSGHYSALNLTNGTYDITGFPGQNADNLPTTVQKVINGNPGDSDTQDITLGDPPPPPPPGTTITSIGTTGNGLPVVFWDDPLTLTTTGCAGATSATFTIEVDGQIVKSGNLTEGPAGTYTASTTSVFPHHGAGVVHIVLNCDGTPPETTDFGVYIDPSGLVKDTSGQPVQGATVTLFRSSSASGPFSPVPSGSTVMSPGNRANPWTTPSDGSFHWDVVAGYYKVRAQKDGCTGSPDRSVAYAETAVLTIPPPVTDLVLTLDCTAQSTPTPPAPVVSPPAASPSSSTPSGGSSSPPPPPVKPAAVAVAKIASLKVIKGKSAVVTVNCLAGAKTACRGKASLKVLAKVKKKTKSVGAGSRSFKGLKPGKSLRLTIRLSKAARKLGRTKGAKLKATTSIQDGAGNKQTLTRTINVKLR